jgi:hypothetical protein
MIYSTNHSKSSARCFASLSGINPFGVVGTLCVTMVSLCPGCRAKPSDSKPPDLSACTRLRVHYGRGALDYFFPGYAQESVLSEEEREHVRSYDTWTVRDRQQIKAFAQLVSQGTYDGKQSGITETEATITGYRGISHKVSFAVHYTSITTPSQTIFRYPAGLLSLASLHPPGLDPLLARAKCARNLTSLIYLGHVRDHDPRQNLDPNQWCDTIVQYFRDHYTIHGELGRDREERDFPDGVIARMFACPRLHAVADVNNASSPPLRSPHRVRPQARGYPTMR